MFPWTQTQWQRLTERVRQHSLPHAILVTGPIGSGKVGFTTAFAQALLCEKPDSTLTACGQCRSCQQFLSQSHPDFYRISPEEDARSIKIDQIRELRERFTLASHRPGYRVAIISPADALNTAAANSLLKTLEEPPAQTVLILLSHQPSLLPATIRSRCQRIALVVPTQAAASQWLQVQVPNMTPGAISDALAATQGAPLAAQNWLQHGLRARDQAAFESFVAVGQQRASPLAIAGSWLKADQEVPIQWLYRWLGDIIRLKCGQTLQVIDSTRQNALNKLAQQVHLSDLFSLLGLLTQTMRSQGVALNQQLIYESILLRWADINSRRGVS